MHHHLVRAVIAAAGDRGCLSDELHFAATTPAERHHLDHGRANVLRALDIRSDDTVLELGAEYGALTRYLGEHAAEVHAVEPDPASAEVAALRTAGLPGVTVTPGRPAGARYDLAVLAEPFATPAVLHELRLNPDGAIVVAVDDLVGRRAVEAAMRAAGLDPPRVLRCVPDRRVSRAVLADELAVEQPRLAEALGTGTGYLLVTGRWPAEQLARYFNTADRAGVWCTGATVVRTPTGAEVRHAPLRPDPVPVGGVSVRSFVDPVRDAPTILAVLLEEPWRVRELLTGWRELVRTQAPVVGPALWDLAPHNVLVDGARLYPIDLEWEYADAGVREVTERGLLVLAHYLTEAGWQGAAPGGTMRELAGWLGVLLDLEPSYVDDALAREVTFSGIASCGTPFGAAEIGGAIRQVWEQRLAARTTRYGSPRHVR